MKDDPVVVMARRQALAHWIKTKFGGSQAAFIESTSPKINQGEVSGLLRNKSFREKRAEALERQANMPEGYLVRAEIRAAEAIQPSHKTPPSEPAGLRAGVDESLLARLTALATPRTAEILVRIAQANSEGRLTDNDLDLLAKIASRFEKA